MSFMHFDAGTAIAVQANVVTLSGGTAIHFDSNFATAGFEFRADGTVFKKIGGNFIQVNSETDWIIPHNAASIDYEIRAHQTPGGISLGGEPQDVFLTLDSDRLWLASCARFCSQLGFFFVDIRWQDGTDLLINNMLSLHDGVPVMRSREYGIRLEAL